MAYLYAPWCVDGFSPKFASRILHRRLSDGREEAFWARLRHGGRDYVLWWCIEIRGSDSVPEEAVPTAGPSSTVIKRRAYGSGVLQLEKRGESGPYWYFHHRNDGKQMTIYLGKTHAPEIELAQINGAIGG